MNSYNALIATSTKVKSEAGRRLTWIEIVNNEDPAINHYGLPQGNKAAEQDAKHPSNTGANGSPGPYYGRSDDEKSKQSPKLALLPEEESADSSDDDYRWADSYDSDCEIDEERSTSRPENTSTKTPHAPTVSRVQQKRDDFAKKGVELDSYGIRMGVVRNTESGGIEVLHNGAWFAAVYHHEIRGKLLYMTDKNGKYDVEPARGAHKLDRTAFKKDHVHWRFDERKLRPECLFVWDDPGYEADKIPKFWYDRGRMVLSAENRPLRKFSEIPLTLSGQCEGLRLELFRRLNSNISLAELKARMPVTTSKRLGLTDKTVGLPALGNRMARSRLITGMKAWCMREGSDVRIRRMLEMIPKHIQEDIVRSNSTCCFRDFTQAEIAYIEEGNKGTESSMKKAGPRKLSEDIRREKQEHKQSIIEGKKGDGLIIHPVVEEALQRTTQMLGTSHAYSEYARDASRWLIYPQTKFGQSRLRKYLEASTSKTNSPYTNVKRPASPLPAETAFKRSKVLEEVKVKQPGGTSENSSHGPPAAQGHSDQTAKGNPQYGPDFRFKKPSNAHDLIRIQQALELSRYDYERRLGYPPALTDRTESYAFQLSQLQASFSERTRSGHDTPALKWWGKKWTSMESWRTVHGKVEGGVKKNVSSLEGDTLIEKSKD
ncbi:MAG: hypothetical protein Q9216_002493 [Gyalolechia sp. 2 TL-2023]